MPEEKQRQQPRSSQGPKTEPGQQPPGPHRIADEPVAEAEPLGATVQSPMTETGLPVEEQIRKEWDPKKNGGLPNSLPTRRQSRTR